MPLPRRLLPSLAALRALDALDRLGSASAVAEELSLTQSAVSRQLRELEAQLRRNPVAAPDRRIKRIRVGGGGSAGGAKFVSVGD